MSEQIDNSKYRKAELKRLILKLHEGESEQNVREELLKSLSNIPYGEVVEVEQELIEEGLPEEEVLKLCDAHSSVLQGNIDISASQNIPPGHPVDTLVQENKMLREVSDKASDIINSIGQIDNKDLHDTILDLTGLFNNLKQR